MIDESTVRQLLSEHKAEIAADFDTRLSVLKDEMLAAFTKRQDDYGKRLDALQKSYEDRWAAQQKFNESTNTSLSQNTATLASQAQSLSVITERTELLSDLIERWSALFTQHTDAMRDNSLLAQSAHRRLDEVSVELQDIIIRSGQMANVQMNLREQQNQMITSVNKLQNDLLAAQNDLRTIANAIERWQKRAKNAMNFMLDRRGFALTVGASMVLAELFGWISWSDVSHFVSLLFGVD